MIGWGSLFRSRCPSGSDEPQESVEKVYPKFILFVKTLDEDGFVDESKCGWLRFDEKNRPELTMKMSTAKRWEDREPGRGSAEDWMKLLSEDHPEWKIMPPKYVET